MPSHTYLESWQTTTFGEKILGTFGDKRPILEKRLEKIERSAGDALMIFFYNTTKLSEEKF